MSDQETVSAPAGATEAAAPEPSPTSPAAPETTILALEQAPQPTPAALAAIVETPAPEPAPAPQAGADAKPSLVAAMTAKAAAWIPRAGFFLPSRAWAAPALGAVAALAIGWGGATLINYGGQRGDNAALAHVDQRVSRLAEDFRTVREAIERMTKAMRPRGADDLKPTQDRIAALAEAIERFRQDQNARTNVIVGAIDRVEKLDRETSTRIAQLSDRIERIERQTLTTGSIAAPVPATAAATPPAQQPAPPPLPPMRAAARATPETPAVTAIPQTRPERVVEGWTLRDIYDGMALIENRRAGAIEVEPGQTVRGLGRIEKIERRGRRWVVVTDQGVIAGN